MKQIKILVPTDFSNCANNALDYALGFAHHMNAQLIIMHSILYNDASFASQSHEKQNQQRYNDAKEGLDRTLAYAQKKNPKLTINTLLDGGSAELSITSVLESEEIDYVIMGTEGASGLKASIFGSFTSNILLIAHCPVFTIPLTAKYKNIKNIVCATEMNESENHAIVQAIEMADKFSAAITFTNINSNKKEQDILFRKFKGLISELTSYSDIHYEMIVSNDIVGSIDDYVAHVNPDLLVTLGKKRDIFDKLFGKKITRKLCLYTTIPLLSFPIAQKESVTSTGKKFIA